MYYRFLQEKVVGMQQAVEDKTLSRIYGKGRGWAFSQADFVDLGHRPTIDSALHRREHEATIRRVIRGIYDYPRHSNVLRGPVSPDQVAHALARNPRYQDLDWLGVRRDSGNRRRFGWIRSRGCPRRTAATSSRKWRRPNG